MQAYKQVKSAVTGSPFIWLLAIGLLVSFTPLRLLSLVVIIYTVSRLIPLRWGLIGRFVVAGVLFASANALLAAIAFLAHVPLSSASVLSLFMLVLGGFVVWRPIAGPLLPSWSALLNLDDWLALVVAVVPVVLLVMQVFPHLTINKLAPTIMEGGDNSSHIEILRADDIDHGLAISTSSTHGLPAVYAAYPQGWHYNGAFEKWVLEKLAPINSPTRLLGFYYVYCAIWLGGLSFLICRIALDAQFKIRKQVSRWSKVAVVVISEIGLLGWIFPLQASGFQPQIGAMACLLVVALFLAEAYSVLPDRRRYPYLLLAGLAAAGCSLFWVFLAPIAIIALVLGLGQLMYRLKSWRPPNFTLIPGVLLSFGILFQLYVQYKNPAAGGGFSAFGYVPDMLPMYVLLGTMLGLSLYVYVRTTTPKLLALYVITAVAILFALVIMAIQSLKYGEPRYYYYKATFTYVLFATIVLAAVGGDLLARLLAARPRVALSRFFHTGFVVVSFLIIAAMFFVSFKSAFFDLYYHKQVSGISPDQASFIDQLYVANPVNDLHFVSVGSCDRGQDIRASLLATALAWSPDVPTLKPIKTTLSSQSTSVVFGQIYYYLHTQHTALYVLSVDQALSQSLQAYLASRGMAPSAYLHLTTIDPDPTLTASAVCPARLGA